MTPRPHRPNAGDLLASTLDLARLKGEAPNFTLLA